MTSWLVEIFQIQHGFKGGKSGKINLLGFYKTVPNIFRNNKKKGVDRHNMKLGKRSVSKDV